MPPETVLTTIAKHRLIHCRAPDIHMELRRLFQGTDISYSFISFYVSDEAKIGDSHNKRSVAKVLQIEKSIRKQFCETMEFGYSPAVEYRRHNLAYK